MSPERRRRTVQSVRRRLGEDKVSERRACRALGQPRGTQRYRPQRPDMDRRLLEEMRRLVRICYGAETKSDALKQLYTVFARERGDVLADAKISGPGSPIIEGLFRAIRSTYQVKDR